MIERPASVVKELVENALDAGAHQVRVELAGGGIGRIRVRDDGHGIPAEELLLALGRHCTSKLTRLADLDTLASLGFRGEALPSIASVSRLRIASCAGPDAAAFEVRQEGVSAPPSGPHPVAHPPGTTVEVEDLFYNVPARRRFLKAEATEFEQVEQFLRRLALSRPEVSFRLEHPGRRGFSIAAAVGPDALAVRVAGLFGRPFARAMRPVEARASGLEISGWIAPPQHFAPAHTGLALWTVNGRVVRDPALARAVRMACGEALPAGRQPAYCLHLLLAPETLDVNVHPMKLEVRYRDARRVQDFVLSSLRAVLAAAAEVTAAVPPAGMVWPPAVGSENHTRSADLTGFSRATAPLPNVAEGVAEEVASGAWAASRGGERRSTQGYAQWPGTVGVDAAKRSSPAAAAGGGWVAGGRAWVAPAVGGLHLLDPARWLADRAWRALAGGTGDAAVAGQRLLVPVRATIDAESAAAVEAARGMLGRLGLEIHLQPAESGAELLLLTLPEPLALLHAEALSAALARHAREAPGAEAAGWARWFCDRLLAVWSERASEADLPAIDWPSLPSPGDAPACAPSSPYRPYWHWIALGAAGAELP